MEALMTPTEVRQFLNISRSTYGRLLELGLPHVGWSALRRFDKQRVLAWLGGDDSEAASATEPGTKV